MHIRIKRVYDTPSQEDGQRVLVDRLWPRGLTKEAARLDAWVKELAPSNELRRWYGHDPTRWEEFQRRYFDELDARPDAVKRLVHRLETGPATFLFSSKELELNNARALKLYLEKRE